MGPSAYLALSNSQSQYKNTYNSQKDIHITSDSSHIFNAKTAVRSALRAPNLYIPRPHPGIITYDRDIWVAFLIFLLLPLYAAQITAQPQSESSSLMHLRNISWTDSGTSMTFLGNFTRLANTFSDTSQIDFTQTYKQVVLATSPAGGSVTTPLSPHNLTLSVLGSYAVSDKIVSVCRSGDIIYIGGQISGLSNNPTVSNLFAATLNNRSVTINDMQGGLSAPVSALACVGSTLVWATSNTLANLSMVGLASTADGIYSGYVAIWSRSTSTWISPPSNGLDGPVNSMKVDSKGVLYFGGSFMNTADGPSSLSPTSQAISITAGNIVAPGVVDAGLLSCLSGKNGWVMPATTGTIEFQLGASITISAVALQNLVGTTDGVKTFSMISPSVSPGKPYLLVLVDSNGKTGSACTICALPQDGLMHVFHVVGPEKTPPSNDVQITVLESYGLSTSGLATIQLFQRDIIVYANPVFNAPSCVNISTNRAVSSTTLVGPWTIPNPALPATQISVANPAIASSSFATFNPNIGTAGQFRVEILIPACMPNSSIPTTSSTISIPQSPTSDICASRGNITVSIIVPGDEKSPYTTAVNLKTSVGQRIPIGVFYLHNDSVFNISCASSTGTSIAIESFSITRLPSTTGLKYLALIETGTTDAKFSPLRADVLPDASQISALAITAKDAVFIAGKFTIAAAISNIARYTPQSTIGGINGWTSLSGGGLNGIVAAMEAYQALLFVGGDFGMTLDGQTILPRIAIYDTENNTWRAMGGGVNAPVTYISIDAVLRTVRIIGTFTLAYLSSTDTTGMPVKGVLVWSIDSNMFIVAKEGVSGVLDVSVSMGSNDNLGRDVYIDAGIVTDMGSMARTGYGAAISVLGENGIDGLDTIPLGSRFSAVSWDDAHGQMFVAGRFGGSTAERLSLAVAPSSGSGFRMLGIDILDGDVYDMLYLDVLKALIVCGSFKNVRIRNTTSTVSGFFAVDTTTVSINKAISLDDPTASILPAVNVRQLKAVNLDSFVVLGDFTLPSIGCYGACIWNITEKSWTKVLSGVRGTYQAVDISPNGVLYFGGKFAVDSAMALSTTRTADVTLISLSSSEAQPQVVKTQKQEAINLLGNVTALCISPSGSIYITTANSSDNTTAMSVYNGNQVYTHPFQAGSVVTGMSPIIWKTGSSSNISTIQGVMMTGRIMIPRTSIANGSVNAPSPFVVALYDPVNDVIAPFVSAIPSSSVVTRVRSRTAFNGGAIETGNKSTAKTNSMPYWAIVLIAVAVLMATLILMWIIYIVCNRSRYVKSRARVSKPPAGDIAQKRSSCQDSIGGPHYAPPVSLSRLHDTVYSMPGGLDSRQGSNDTIVFTEMLEPDEIPTSTLARRHDGEGAITGKLGRSSRFPSSTSSIKSQSNERRGLKGGFSTTDTDISKKPDYQAFTDGSYPIVLQSTLSSDRPSRSDRYKQPYQPIPLFAPTLKLVPHRRSGSMTSNMTESMSLEHPLYSSTATTQQSQSPRARRVMSISTFEGSSSRSISLDNRRNYPNDVDISANMYAANITESGRPRRRCNTTSLSTSRSIGTPASTNASGIFGDNISSMSSVGFGIGSGGSSGGPTHDNNTSLPLQSVPLARVGSWLMRSREIVVARDSYRAQDSTELTLHTGDRIEILDSTDPFWWTGRLGSRREEVGLFPASLTTRDLS
ncbi:hypothetical protein BASA62_002355 [Batrachochytrium salamandrivorans]|nr:hypothetical protein BASA62_002355 [Batrachochytrium salamandrivorans]